MKDMIFSPALALLTGAGASLLGFLQSRAGAEALGRMVGRLLALCLFPVIVMLLVGGAYYILARPRRTFIRAFFRWWNVLLGVAVFVLGLLGLMLRSLQ